MLYKPSVNLGLFLILSAVLLSSCSDNKKELIAYAETEDGFTTSSMVAESGIGEILYTLQERLYKPESEEKAMVWQPKGKRIANISYGISIYLDSIKKDIEKQVNIVRRQDGTINIDSSHVVNKAVPGEIVMQCLKHLQQYNDSVVSIDTSFTRQNGFFIEISPAVENYLHNANMLEWLTLLSKIQNKIKSNEYELLRYCKVQSSYNDDSFYAAFPLVTQDYKYIKAGEYITITAGIGSYRWPSRTSITVNGNQTKLQPEGNVIYKCKASGTLGKHTIPVKIHCISPRGITIDSTYRLSYYTLE